MDYGLLTPPFLSAALVASVRAARAHGLGHPDAEECALDFAQHCLECERPLRTPGGRQEPCQRALIHACADHFAADRARGLQRRQHHEAPLPGPAAEEGPDAIASDGLGPETQVLLDEFWRIIESDLARLHASQRDLVERHCLRGESLVGIARTQGKSEDAVRMALRRALRCLRGLLERQGHDAVDLVEFLAPPITDGARNAEHSADSAKARPKTTRSVWAGCGVAMDSGHRLQPRTAPVGG